MQRRDHLVELLERPDPRIHVAVVVHVVAAVGQGRGVERAQPDRIHAELLQVRHAGDDPAQVADPVAVAVREGARIDLVDGGLTPPVGVGLQRGGKVLGDGGHDGGSSGRAGVVVKGLGHLIAPWVRPDITQRCANRYTMIAGAIAIRYDAKATL